MLEQKYFPEFADCGFNWKDKAEVNLELDRFATVFIVSLV